MNSGIYWLASYPKSGNTWMRAFIANLRNEKSEEEIDINEINDWVRLDKWVFKVCSWHANPESIFPAVIIMS